MSAMFPQGTFFGLDLMGGSLQAFSVAENVVSDNIANVDTPGATQQVAVLSPAQPVAASPYSPNNVLGTAGEGVVVSQIQGINDEAYNDLFRGATSSQNYYSTEETILDSVQSSLGDPDAGVSTAFNDFQTAVTALVNSSTTGSGLSAASGVVTAAQSLATSLGQSSAAVTGAMQQTLQQGATIVQTVNGLLTQIASLNGQIRSSTAVGDDPNTFVDERNYDVDQLSQYISVQTSIQSDGSALVMVNGQALVNDTVAYQLAAPVVGTSSNGSQSFNVYFATTPTTSSSAPSIPLGSGQLAALQSLYNNNLTNYNDQLNQFASSLANEVNRITESGYDANSQAGAALFQPIDADLPISAGNIECGINDSSELPTVLANTAADTSTTTGIVPLNSANNTVDPSASLIGNTSLANPPAAAGLIGTLSISVDGVTENFGYTTATMPATGASVGVVYADNLQDFVSTFNDLGSGVTASYDSSTQTIEFQRDPSNESLALRGAQQGLAQTASFTIGDTNDTAGSAADASLLGVLGATNINNVAQNASNAYAASDNGVANALTSLFSSNVGFPAIETTSAAAATAGVATTVALPTGINNVQVGQQLTIDAQQGGQQPQENVTVTAVSYSANGTESVTFTPQYSHAAGYTVTSAQSQTFEQFYGQLTTQVGLDTQTATTGNSTQTNLAQTINTERQSIVGINLDDQTQNLIVYQTAYQAAAKTISTLSQLLDTIVNGLGTGS